ncbi:hypothetical protein GT204_27130 [Streptomyces sp. SID4919]|uniref:DUF3566 domain-containing protein n=1 Tax=unclassified Streptomyces TaxID=2593676 RepID=UPI000823C1CF|nr:DUF3566 domain-containing protein [Streptomyces sp. AmelKG-E11A]MYY12477.1 hypothetical protein [Streptomyces sp. SID4919]SCK18240.1 Transmembrane protein of unknown function [Streptomyces sp. AmelKG-E11A]
MSGATGAGSSGAAGRQGQAGAEDRSGPAAPAEARAAGQDGARGSASVSPASDESHVSQGGTVTDTRGPRTQSYDGYAGQAPEGRAGAPSGAREGALPGERPQQPGGQPYHPPQAYQTAPSGAVRRPRTGARTTPRTRKARLRVAKADPWSVMKVSFLLSIALGICTIIAAAVLWMVMDAMGVFSTVGGTISEATGSNESNGFDLQSFLSLPRVLMFTSIIAVIDVVLATALATLGAFIYNLSAGFVGGVELTLAEDE